MLNQVGKILSATFALTIALSSTSACLSADLPDIRGLEINPITITNDDDSNFIETSNVNAVSTKAKSFTSDEKLTLKGEISRLTALVGKSHLVRFDEPVTRMSITDPSLADLVLLSPQEMLVNGKTSGITSLLVWGESGDPVFFDLQIKQDLTSLNDAINDLFPTEKPDLRFTDDSHLVLSGHVSSSIAKSKLQTLAEAHGYTFVDLSESPIPQVIIEVKIAEASNAITKQFGTTLAMTNASGSSIADNVVDVLGSNDSSIGFDNTGLQFWSYGQELYGAMHAYEQKGLIKILAEPKLVSTNGNQASFNAGQEVPVPTGLDERGNIAYEFKDVGVNMQVTPTIQEETERITLNVIPEVSEIDSTITITQTDGSIIYGFRKRKAETTVDLKNGQTLVIAGLLQRNDITTKDQVPYLSEIPIIGKLFTSNDYRKGETELIIFVTPKIIYPSSNINRV